MQEASMQEVSMQETSGKKLAVKALISNCQPNLQLQPLVAECIKRSIGLKFGKRRVNST